MTTSGSASDSTAGSTPTAPSAEVQQAAAALELPEATLRRLTAIGRTGPGATRPDLPAPDDADALLRTLGADPHDRRAALAARPDPAAHPELWLLLTLLTDELARTLDHPVPAGGFHAWPALPAALGDTGRHLYVWAMLGAVPAVRRLHARRGVPDRVSWDSLRCLAGVMTTHREVTGETGAGLFDLWGPPLAFRGADYQLGRHSFTRADLAFGTGTAGRVLMVHVPPIGPLTPAASADSFEQARAFFPRHYPEEPVAALTCTSWLLDPQLAEYLPATSNILAFQRRFPTLLPHHPDPDPEAGDRELLRFGLHRTPPDGPLDDAYLATLPQTTTFDRAFTAHLRSGRHWHHRSGWAPVGF